MNDVQVRDVSCIKFLTQLIREELDVNQCCNFSMLTSHLSDVDKNRARLGRLFLFNSKYSALSNFKELKPLDKSFKCGKNIIFDFKIQRLL